MLLEITPNHTEAVQLLVALDHFILYLLLSVLLDKNVKQFIEHAKDLELISVGFLLIHLVHTKDQTGHLRIVRPLTVLKPDELLPCEIRCNLV